MAVASTYNVGTATINAGEVTVTGQGTTWLTSGIRAGDLFWAAGLFVRIASVASNTSLTLAYGWPGANRAAANYEIHYTPDAERVLAATRQMLTALSSEAVSPLAGLAPSANKFAYYTGPGAAALADLSAFGRAFVATADLADARSALDLRERLTGARTYYVSTTGHDANNNGLSAAAPFLTLSRAISAAFAVDTRGYGVTIQMAAGTYSGASIAGPLMGGGVLSIRGNVSDPSTVVLTSHIYCLLGALVAVSGLKWAVATALMDAISLERGSYVNISNVEFGPLNGGVHIRAAAGSLAQIIGNYTISGGALMHIMATTGSQVYGGSFTAALSGTPAFTWCFVRAERHGGIVFWSFDITGAATGYKFTSEVGGVIDTGGKPVGYLPGSMAGVTGSGGIYV